MNSFAPTQDNHGFHGLGNPQNHFRIVQTDDRTPATLRFKMAVPTSFGNPDSTPTVDDRSGDYQRLAAFRSAHGTAGISVAVCNLLRDVSPADWLQINLDRSQAEVVETYTTASPAGELIDVLTRVNLNSIPLLRRTTTVKSGSLLFLIEASAHEAEYPQLANEFAAALASFRLLAPDTAPTAESLVEVRPATGPNWRFLHPASWQVVNRKEASAENSVELATEHKGAIAGRILVACCSKFDNATADGMAAQFAQWLQTIGVHHGGAPLIPGNSPPGVTDAYSFLPRATIQQRPLETGALVLGTKTHWFLLGLLGPTREESPEWWAINKRAFEIVRDSLQFESNDGVNDGGGRSSEAGHVGSGAEA